MNDSKHRAVFLDRDGVINQRVDGQYVVRWRDFQFIPDTAEAIRALNQAGWLVIVITNQSAVAKKLLSESELRQIHQNMLESLHCKGARIDAIYYCPHDVEDDCLCRKPKPGLLIQAACDHQIELSSSWIIGDDVRDIEAGQAAGCSTIWLRDISTIYQVKSEPHAAVESIAGAAAIILRTGGFPSGADGIVKKNGQIP